MSKNNTEQTTLDRFPVRLIVVHGNNTVPAGTEVRGYLNAGLGWWHTNRGNFLPSDVRYANVNICSRDNP